MNINDFATKVTQEEGLKKSTNVAQVKELLRIINARTGGVLYATIKLINTIQK